MHHGKLSQEIYFLEKMKECNLFPHQYLFCFKVLLCHYYLQPGRYKYTVEANGAKAEQILVIEKKQ
jgi:hypothetical protein